MSLERIRNRMANVKQQRTANFEQAFWGDVGSWVSQDLGGYNSELNTLHFPTQTLPDKTQMWNKYNQLAKKRGVHANYSSFMQQYDNMIAAEDSKFLSVVNRSKMMGAKDKDIREAILKNPEALNRLNKVFAMADAETQAQIASIFKDEQTWGEWASENPFPAIAGGLGIGAAGLYGAGKVKEMFADDTTKKKKTGIGPKPKKKTAPKYVTQSGVTYEKVNIGRPDAKVMLAEYKKYKDGEFKKYQDKGGKLDRKSWEKTAKTKPIVAWAKEKYPKGETTVTISKAHFNNWKAEQYNKYKDAEFKKYKDGGGDLDRKGWEKSDNKTQSRKEWNKGKTISSMLEGKSAKEIKEIASDKYAPKGKVGTVGQTELDQKKLDEEYEKKKKSYDERKKKSKSWRHRYPKVAKGMKWGGRGATALYLFDLARSMFGSEE